MRLFNRIQASIHDIYWENQCTDHLMTDELRREEGEPLPLSVADIMETLVRKILKESNLHPMSETD